MGSSDYEQLLGWLDSQVEFFSTVETDRYDLEVPSCPGWTIRNVITHLARGSISWLVVQQHEPDTWMAAAQKAAATVPSGRIDELFYGTSQALTAVLRSHEPDDPCTFHLIGPQNFGSHALHSLSEFTIHRIGIEQALELPIDESQPQAADVLRWTTEIALPSFVATIPDAGPAPTIEFRTPENGSSILGANEPAAVISGDPLDLVCLMWNRDSGATELEGSEAALDWWRSVPGRSFQLPART